MNRSRFVIALLASTSLTCAALVGLGACAANTTSGDGSSGDLPTAEAGGKDASTRDTSVPDSYVPPPPVQDAGADCGKAPKLFPPKPDGGLYCPFSSTGAGGKDIYCTDAEQCCENPAGSGASTCVAKGTACPVPNATTWECEDSANCPAGQVCCAHSGAAGAVTVGTDTCGAYLSKFSGTKCAATCAAGELPVCEQQSECTTGTCTAVKPKGNSIGVCN